MFYIPPYYSYYGISDWYQPSYYDYWPVADAFTSPFYHVPFFGGSHMLWNSARAIGSFAADWPGVKGMGRYFDRLYRMRGLGRDDVEPPRKKSVAEGTDSPSYAERGVSYLREKVGFGHQLPQQGEVLHNLFGERPDEDDEARLSAYDGAIAEERKRDTALRIFIENIIHDLMYI